MFPRDDMAANRKTLRTEEKGDRLTRAMEISSTGVSSNRSCIMVSKWVSYRRLVADKWHELISD